jgi:thiamine-phosphate diphosphorylase/hydroxyethylthiazole kinase
VTKRLKSDNKNRKTNSKSIIGTVGVRQILEALTDASQDVPTVCIGGINASNLKQVVSQSCSPKRSLSGVAVVSAIIAAPDPKNEARKLLALLKDGMPVRQPSPAKLLKATDPRQIVTMVPAAIKAVHEATPLSHNMTNLVSTGDSRSRYAY